MVTSITSRGQTVIPAELRRRWGIDQEPGWRLGWIDDGEGIRVLPIPPDPIKALRGRGKGERLLEHLLQDRARERARQS